MPGLVYTLGIHPLYVEQSTQADLDLLATEVKDALHDPRFVGIGEIGLDYFVEGLDRTRQAYFFEQQLDLAQAHDLPVVMHVRRSQDAILKALRQRRIRSGIAHAFNGSMQQAEQFIQLGFKLGFGGAATYTRALQIRRLSCAIAAQLSSDRNRCARYTAGMVARGGNSAQCTAIHSAHWGRTSRACGRWTSLILLRQHGVTQLTALPRWSATLNPLRSK